MGRNPYAVNAGKKSIWKQEDSKMGFKYQRTTFKPRAIPQDAAHAGKWSLYRYTALVGDHQEGLFLMVFKPDKVKNVIRLTVTGENQRLASFTSEGSPLVIAAANVDRVLNNESKSVLIELGLAMVPDVFAQTFKKVAAFFEEDDSVIIASVDAEKFPHLISKGV